jgi:TonB family protein
MRGWFVRVLATVLMMQLTTVPIHRSDLQRPAPIGMTFTAAPPPGRCSAQVGFPGRPPEKVFDVKPIYPEAARARRITGVVIVAATIDEQGQVIRADVLRHVEMLDAAAIAAVRQWRFAPATVNGTAACLTMTVAVSFP